MFRPVIRRFEDSLFFNFKASENDSGFDTDDDGAPGNV